MRAVFESQLGASARALYDYHAGPSAFGRLLPPWDRVELVGKHPGLINGSVANIIVRRGPLALPGAFEHSNVIEGSEFTDTQLKGPFRRWRHRHRFISTSGDSFLRAVGFSMRSISICLIGASSPATSFAPNCSDSFDSVTIAQRAISLASHGGAPSPVCP